MIDFLNLKIPFLTTNPGGQRGLLLSVHIGYNVFGLKHLLNTQYVSPLSFQEASLVIGCHVGTHVLLLFPKQLVEVNMHNITKLCEQHDIDNSCTSSYSQG